MIQRRDHLNFSRHDWRRTQRFALIGLTLHGPYFYQGFRVIDATFGASRTAEMASKKTLAGQLTLFPVYCAAFFAYMGLLEGKSAERCIQKVKESYMPTYIGGSVFWPVANMINFMCIPSTGRVAYVSGAGLLWNSFLSWSNSKYGQSTRTMINASSTR
ncbi:hypothetical protein WJX72_007267 [[Myrmecia] bisecta]|uniref:Mpv17-like protein n=1 Tax=[Myrmecia] bisecta TaxID=41462 RepID=A0AAW1QFP3_9CHLO